MRNHHFKNLEKAKKSDKYLSTTEICNVIGCHQVTLFKLQKDGYLEGCYMRLGNKRTSHYRWSLEAVKSVLMQFGPPRRY